MTATEPVGLLPVEHPPLEKSLRHGATLGNFVLTVLMVLLSLVALSPLLAVLGMLVVRGGRHLSVSLFTDLPPAAGMVGGGIGNAIQGTLIMVGIAGAIAVPVGILAAVYLAEFSSEGVFPTVVRFTAKVLSGFPSILAGVFAYALVVMLMGRFSALAGGVALSVLMIPTVILTTEESLKLVPTRMKEAAIGMGATRTQTVLKITLPVAMPGVLTGVMLAVARAMGETAPLLLTSLFSFYWFQAVDEPTASLAVLIYDFSGSPFENQQDIAWAASLVLVVIVLAINLVGQLTLRRKEIR